MHKTNFRSPIFNVFVCSCVQISPNKNPNPTKAQKNIKDFISHELILSGLLSSKDGWPSKVALIYGFSYIPQCVSLCAIDHLRNVDLMPNCRLGVDWVIRLPCPR